MKKIISLFLTVAVCLSLCTTFAFANEIPSIEASEDSMFLVETNEETIQVDDGEGNVVYVTIVENIYRPVGNADSTRDLTPTEEIGEKRTYTIRISNEAMGVPSIITGGVATLLELGVAKKAAEIVANAVAAKIGANLLPGINIVSWLLSVVAFYNGRCGNKGIEVNVDFVYKGFFWHREDRYVYGWYHDGVSVSTY